MAQRIIRGVRVATPRGIEPASVFIEDGRITFVAGYEDIPREARAEELGKSVLMPGLVAGPLDASDEGCKEALRGGITSLASREPRADVSELSHYLSECWTTMRDSDESLDSLTSTLSTEPARRAGLGERKGQIAAGFDADFVIWNPEYTVAGTSPLLYGLVRQVIVAGVTRVREGQLL